MKRSVLIGIPPDSTHRARVGIAEAQALDELAKLEFVNKSEAVRLAIREACAARGLWPPPQPENDGQGGE